MKNKKMDYDDSPLGQLLASFQNYISECFPEKIAEEIFEFRDLYTEIYIAVYDLKEIKPEAVEKYNRLVKKYLAPRNYQT